MSQALQYLFSGLTSGAIYALAAVGFSVIYNASGVINFAQGEFIMLGGVSASLLTAAGMPLFLAIPLAVLCTALVGFLLEKAVIEPARDAGTVSLIIVTIGASIFLQGAAQVVFGKGQRSVPSFSGEQPIAVAGATILPQSLWMIGTAGVLVLGLVWFFVCTNLGKALLATSHNRLAAQLVGIDVRRVLSTSFVLSAALGAIAGAVAAPITLTSHDVGTMIGLKGFVAATLGSLGSATGAVVGGFILGLTEALCAGYVSSAYKDAVPFIVILLVFFFLPRGLFARRVTERV